MFNWQAQRSPLMFKRCPYMNVPLHYIMISFTTNTIISNLHSAGTTEVFSFERETYKHYISVTIQYNTTEHPSEFCFYDLCQKSDVTGLKTIFCGLSRFKEDIFLCLIKARYLWVSLPSALPH